MSNLNNKNESGSMKASDAPDNVFAEKQSSLDAKAAALAKEPDEESKISKMLKSMPRWRYYTLAVLTGLMTCFQLYIKLGTPLQPWAQIPLHLCFALVIVFLFNPMAEKSKLKSPSVRVMWWAYEYRFYLLVLFIEFQQAQPACFKC